MAETLRFKASAYLQTLIGRELFRSPLFAIVELVKNAFDSGATKVEITIVPQSEREPGEIEIRDNGEGMSLAGFEDLHVRWVLGATQGSRAYGHSYTDRRERHRTFRQRSARNEPSRNNEDRVRP